MLRLNRKNIQVHYLQAEKRANFVFDLRSKMKNFNIAVLNGDGIGPEICNVTKQVLKKIAGKFGHNFIFNDILIGGASIDQFGAPLTKEALDKCLVSDSVLLGAVGGPKWDGMQGQLRPEKGLLSLRRQMGLYANLRPANIFKELGFVSPLKQEIINLGLDILMVRELTGGIYFGDQKTVETENGIMAYDTEKYYQFEITRILETAFKFAQKRRGILTSVDKANVLESSRLWRKTFYEVSKKYPDVQIFDMYVDNCAMQLIKNPSQFDVIVTSNLFGDILSDELAATVGSIGMMPSASIGNDKRGLYEPIHGSAPDIAGQDKANPVGCILAGAMMLRHSFNLNVEAAAIEKAVSEVIKKGYRTKDIFKAGDSLVGTKEMGRLICELI